MHGFMMAWRKYAQFTGRSGRREFWGFALTYLAITIVMSTLLVIGMQGAREDHVPVLVIVIAATWVPAALALFIPWLSVSWRRYQDCGLPGAIAIVGLFIPLVTLIVGLLPGTVGDNDFGAPPDHRGE